jgi:P4 family phage/plasmid primase-like protien
VSDTRANAEHLAAEAEARAAISEPKTPDARSEIGLSNSFAQSPLGADIRYCEELSRWFFYNKNEGRWVEDSKLGIYTLVKRFLTKVAQDCRDGVNTEKLNEKKKVAAVVELTKSHAKRIAISKEQFDADPWLLNTPDGAVDLRTGTIRPATREDYFTRTTKVAPRQMATPVFDTFIRDILGARIPVKDCTCAACTKRPHGDHAAEVLKLVAYLKRRYGYALSGDVKKQGLVVELGDGGNGKGVLNDFFSQDIWGTTPTGYSCDIAVEALLNRKGFEAHPTELMDLFHARLVLARESDEETQWNAGRVKRLSGGDRVKARRMRQDFIEFDPTHHLFIFGNNKPMLPGSDQNAWKRRLDLVMFPQTYAIKADPSKNILEADEGLRDKLRPEAPGVLAKLIEAGIECQKMVGFGAPDTVLQASDNYLAEQNYLVQWLDANCDLTNPFATETATNLFADFVKWCAQEQMTPCPRYAFNEKLKKAGIHIGTDHAGHKGICKGIKLKSRDPEPPPRDPDEPLPTMDDRDALNAAQDEGPKQEKMNLTPAPTATVRRVLAASPQPAVKKDDPDGAF